MITIYDVYTGLGLNYTFDYFKARLPSATSSLMQYSVVAMLLSALVAYRYGHNSCIYLDDCNDT